MEILNSFNHWMYLAVTDSILSMLLVTFSLYIVIGLPVLYGFNSLLNKLEGNKE